MVNVKMTLVWLIALNMGTQIAYAALPIELFASNGALPTLAPMLDLLLLILQPAVTFKQEIIHY